MAMISIYQCFLKRGRASSTRFILATKKSEVIRAAAGTRGWQAKNVERMAGGNAIRISAFLIEGLSDSRDRFWRAARLYRTNTRAKRAALIIARDENEAKGTLGGKREVTKMTGPVVLTPSARLALRRRTSQK